MNCLDKSAHESQYTVTVLLRVLAGYGKDRTEGNHFKLNCTGQHHRARFLRGHEGQYAENARVEFSRHQCRGDLRVAAQLKNRHVFFGFETRSIQGRARESIRIRSILRYTNHFASEIFELANP